MLVVFQWYLVSFRIFLIHFLLPATDSQMFDTKQIKAYSERQVINTVAHGQ